MGSRSAGIGFGGTSGGGIGALPFATRGDTTTLAIFSSSANRDQYYTGNPQDLIGTALGAGLEAVGVSTTAPSADGLTAAYVRNSSNTDWIPVASNYIGPQGPQGPQGANTVNVYRNGAQVGDSLQAESLDFAGAGVTVAGTGTAKVVTIARLAVRDDVTTVGAAATLVFSGYGVRVTGTGSTKVIEIDPLSVSGDNALPEKTSLSDADFLLIADSADGFAKKRISVATLVAHLTGGT